MITNKEVFTVYGLIIGMITNESKANLHRSYGYYTTQTPALDWERQWHAHPHLKKARSIYLKEAKKAGKIK